MISILYDCFKHWSKAGSVYIYSDPHFSDVEHFKLLKANNNVPEGINTVTELDELQINNINTVCHKCDTLILLGDIGNVELVKRLKAGYKVLITGNHDRGAEYYKRVIKTEKVAFKFSPEQIEGYKQIEKDFGHLDGPGDAAALGSCQTNYVNALLTTHFYNNPIKDGKLKVKHNGAIEVGYNDNNDTWYYFVTVDNHLFDEVYSGPLMISDKIILSHEPIVPCPRYLVNLHGHTHDRPFIYIFDDRSYHNFCAEALNYQPASLGDMIKHSLLSGVADIHRVAVDRAIERKTKREKKTV